MDRWGIDVVVSGSQKGLMTPPGLAFVAANARAIARSAEPRPGRLLPGLGAHPQGRLAQPLHAAGDARAPAPGRPAADRGRGPARTVFARHRVLGRATPRRRPGARADAARPREPGGQRGHRLPRPRGRGRQGHPEPHEVALRGRDRGRPGQALRADRAASATAGTSTSATSLTAIGALELVLRELGQPVEPGAGVAAAQRVFAETPAAGDADARRRRPGPWPVPTCGCSSARRSPTPASRTCRALFTRRPRPRLDARRSSPSASAPTTPSWSAAPPRSRPT